MMSATSSLSNVRFEMQSGGKGAFNIKAYGG